jgi:hypothetical protein
MAKTKAPEPTPIRGESVEMSPGEQRPVELPYEPRIEFAPGGYWLTIHYDEVSAGPFEVVYGSCDQAFGEVVHSFISKDAGVAVFLVPEHLIGSNYEVEGPIGDLPLI